MAATYPGGSIRDSAWNLRSVSSERTSFSPWRSSFAINLLALIRNFTQEWQRRFPARRTARVDPSDVLHYGFLDLSSRVDGDLREPKLPLFLRLRLIFNDFKHMAMPRRHIQEKAPRLQAFAVPDIRARSQAILKPPGLGAEIVER
jgi:hypothetical protein